MWTLNYFDFSKILLAHHDIASFALPYSDTILYLGCLSSMKGQLCSILSEYCFFFSKSRDQLLLVNFQYFQDTVVRPKICKLVLSSAMRISWPVLSVSIGSIKYLSYIWQLNWSSCWKRSSKNSNKKSFIIAPRTLPHPCCGNVTFCHCFACCYAVPHYQSNPWNWTNLTTCRIKRGR